MSSLLEIFYTQFILVQQGNNETCLQNEYFNFKIAKSLLSKALKYVKHNSFVTTQKCPIAWRMAGACCIAALI